MHGEVKVGTGRAPLIAHHGDDFSGQHRGTRLDQNS